MGWGPSSGGGIAYPSPTSGKIPYWNGSEFADSALSQVSGRILATFPNQSKSLDIISTDLYYGAQLRFLYNTSIVGTMFGLDYLGTRFYVQGRMGDSFHIGGGLGLLGVLRVQSYGYQVGGVAVSANPPSTTTVGFQVNLKAIHNANAIEVNSSVGTLGDLAFINASGQIKVAGGTPASASATGTAGQILWDGSYIYICSATDTWKRASIATW